MKTILEVVRDLIKPYIDKNANNIAPVEDSPVENPYYVGDQLIYKGILYNITADISIGDTLEIGTNISVAPKLSNSIKSALNKLKSDGTSSGTDFNFDIQNGVPGWNSAATRDAATFHPFSPDSTASDISYDNKTSCLTATDVQDAIDEMKGQYDSVDAEISDMTGILGAKNLCPNNASSVTQSGVTYTVNADGSVTLTGTATAGNGIVLGTAILTKGTYKLTTGQSTESGAKQYLYAKNVSSGAIIASSNSADGVTPTFTLLADTNVSFHIYCSSGRTGTVTLYSMCKPASIKDENYIPYVPTNRELGLQDKELSSQIIGLATTYTYSNKTEILSSNAPVISAYAIKQGRIVNISLVFGNYQLVQGDWTILGTLTSKFRPAIQQNFNAVSNTDSRSLQARIEPNGSVRIWVPSAITHASVMSLTYFADNSDH